MSNKSKQAKVQAYEVARGKARLPKHVPAGGEHARPHGVAKGQEGQHLLEERVWQGADAVLVSGHSRFLASIISKPVGHFIGQVARTKASRVVETKGHKTTRRKV